MTAPVPAPRTATRWRLLLAGAVLLQLVVLYAPRAPSTGETTGIDKVVHFAIFALVDWTGRRAGLRAGPLVAALLAHAVLSEVLQWALLAHRDGDWRDSLADAVGVAAGSLLPVPGSRRGSRMGPWRGTRATRSPAGR